MSVKRTKHHKQLRKWLGVKHWMPVKIVIPSIYYKKIEVLHEIIFFNNLKYTDLISYLVSFTLKIVYKLYRDYDIISSLKIVKINQWILRNLGLIINLSASSIKCIENPKEIEQTNAEYYIIKRKHYRSNFIKRKPRVRRD
jgi:hypothetical protein